VFVVSILCAKAEDGARVLGDDYDDVTIAGERVNVELLEIWEGAIVADNFVDALQRRVQEFQLEFVDWAVGFLLERADISSKNEWSCCSSFSNSQTSSFLSIQHPFGRTSAAKAGIIVRRLRHG